LRHNLAPQQAYAGALVEAQLGHGRGYHEIRLRMAGAAQPLEWTCWMACGPYHALQARKADAPKMRVLALDERIIGLEIDGRVLLSPGQGRWRWFGRDAFLTSVGLFLVWGLCLRLFRMAKDGPGGVYSTTAW